MFHHIVIQTTDEGVSISSVDVLAKSVDSSQTPFSCGSKSLVLCCRVSETPVGN